MLTTAIVAKSIRSRPAAPYDSASMQGTLFITGDPEADRLLNTDPLAVLLGMLLDQHMQ